MPVVTQLLFPTAPRALSTPGQGWSGHRLTWTLRPRHQERSSRAGAGTQTGTSVHPAPRPPPCADVAHALPVTSCKGANQATGAPSDPGLPAPVGPAGEVSWAEGREHRAEAEPCAHRPLRTRRSTHAHLTVPCGTAASCCTQALPLQPHPRRPRATERTARGSRGPWEAARWRAEAAGWGWAGWCPGPHTLPHVPSPRCPAVGGRVALLWTTEAGQTLGFALTRGLLPGRQWDRDLIPSDFSGRTATKSCWNRGRTPVPPRCAAPRGPTGEPLVHPTGFPLL